jgi:methyl-accepting chemotaxis protein
MNTQPHFQRKWKNLFVEPFVQIKMGFYVLLLSFLYACSFALFIWDVYEEQFFRFETNFLGENAELIFNESGQSTYIFVLGVLIAVFILSILLAVIRRTHRMFGPMVAVERFVDAMARGDYSQRVKIREDDDFQDLVSSLNRMAETFEQKGLK